MDATNSTNTTTNTATKQDIIENIYSLVNEYHNPDLVKYNDAPNSNIITHIYSDGEITEQKGGFAYLQRSERTIEPPVTKCNNIKKIICNIDINIDICRFPKIKVNGNRSKFGYAIVLEKHANEIRNEMLKLL